MVQWSYGKLDLRCYILHFLLQYTGLAVSCLNAGGFLYFLQEFKESVTNDWIDKGLDAVICPGFACPALPLNTALLATGNAESVGIIVMHSFLHDHIKQTTVCQLFSES